MDSMQVLDRPDVDVPLDVDTDVRLDADDVLGRSVVVAFREMSSSLLVLFDLIAELETSQGFLPTYQNAAAWLRWHLGMKGSTARLYVRLARGLSEFPLFRDAFAVGAISTDQLALVLRVATPDNQGLLVDMVRHSTDIDELTARIVELEQRPEPEPVEPGARVHTFWRDDVLRVNATVPGVDGVMVEQALLRLGARSPRDERTGLFRDVTDRMGEALVQMASESLADDGDHDRATVVVHIPAIDLVNQTGDGWDAAGRVFTATQLQRLVCDGRLQPAMHDRGGVTVGVGRTTRTIEPWLRRLVKSRDQGCRFPGCERTRWVELHHILRWASDGPTNLDNLVCLCGFHHRLIHNREWTILGAPNHDLLFYDHHQRLHGPPPADQFPGDWQRIVEKCINHRADQQRKQLASTGAPP